MMMLRKEWGFDGVVITDYAAIAELVIHGAAEDQKEAARLAMGSGRGYRYMYRLLCQLSGGTDSGRQN